MTQLLKNYARALYELSFSHEKLSEAAAILAENPALLEVLKKPCIPLREKERVIERIFPLELRSFMKVVCNNKRAGDLPEILKAYEEYVNENEGILYARLICVTRPSKEQLTGIEKFLCDRYGKKTVRFEFTEDDSLMGGFILKAGNMEYDYSLRGRYRRLEEKLIGG